MLQFLYTDSNDRPVLIEVEVYVVKGMTTPIILGNDFANQYLISLIREGPESYLSFEDTGRRIKIESLVLSGRTLHRVGPENRS